MAVLKSFELKGNKQSFANWISNLSPTETPFTSMIGKDAIEATQYSWQTDRLNPADNHDHEEGSKVGFPARGTTEVLTNFTQIFRKVVSISDTASKVSAHGRSSELNYQMGKSGVELMRDLEFANLNNKEGNPSTSALAGKFSGFEGLVATLDQEDDDTGAIVHKRIIVAKGQTSRINPSDIFDMTYNLFLSGSTANTIMFHPQHAFAFSGMISENTETPNIYRMFDGLDEKFNAQVNKIRDPLGRVYTLVPNRHMPVNRIFFFDPTDWTQTILRNPSAVNLGKFGPSERKMIEMEVGLRHKHPFSSGVLELVSKTIENEIMVDERVMIAGVGDHNQISTTVKIDTSPVDEGVVSWFTSDSEVVYFSDKTTETDSTGKAIVHVLAGDRAGSAFIWSVFRGVQSNKVEILTIPPIMEIKVDNENPAEGAVVNAEIIASYGSGDDIFYLEGLEVNWHCHPSKGVTFTNKMTTTNKEGVAKVSATANTTEEVLIWGTIGEFQSDYIALNYVIRPAAVYLGAKTTDTTVIDNVLEYEASVIDHENAPVEGQEVTWSISDDRVGKLSTSKSITDSDGKATVYIQGLLRGRGTIVAHTPYHSSAPEMFFFGEGADIVVTSNAADNTVISGTPIEMKVSIKGVNGKPIPDVPVHFSIDQGDPIPSGVTNNLGILEEVIHTAAVGSYHVTVFVDDFRYKEVITFIVEEAPTPPPAPEPGEK